MFTAANELSATGHGAVLPPDISVMVPVYNNADTLDELIDRLIVVLEKVGRSFELVFVDDGSTDASLAILRTRASTDVRLRVFALTRNFGGQSASAAACDQARGRWVVHIDADLENFPEDIPGLIAYLEQGYDLVCGFRENRQHGWLSRRLPSQLINWYVRRVTGSDIRDVGCGLRAFERHLIRDLAREGESRRLLTPVLLRRAQRIVQTPVRHIAKPGSGGHSFLSLLGIAVDYFLVTAWRPFLITALASLSAGILALLALTCGAPRMALLLSCTGTLGLLASLVGEYAQRSYQLIQGVPFYELRDPASLPTVSRPSVDVQQPTE